MGKIIKSKNIAVAVMTVLLIGVIASGCNIAAVVSLEPTDSYTLRTDSMSLGNKQ